MGNLKVKFKNLFSRILRLMNTPVFYIGMGLAVIFLSVYDIYSDFLKMKKEHLILIIGILMVINAIHTLLLGFNKMIIIDENKNVIGIKMRVEKIMKSPVHYVFIGLVIIITSTYDIYEDFFKMKKEHLSLFLGIIQIILALTSVYKGDKDVYEGIKEEVTSE